RHRAAPPMLDEDGVLPTVGAKELVAHLPFHLGLGPGDAVAFPHIAYPTYDMGARFVGAEPMGVDMAQLAVHGDAALPDPSAAGRIRLLWLNSPSNPTGEVLDVAQLAALLAWARERGILVASDECYALLPWTVDEVPSILDPRVNDGSLDGLLCVYSLSKQSYLARSRAAGGESPGSEAGLCLWTSFGEDAMTSVDRLADLGVLVAPGMFYGEGGARFVRVALPATDERIAAAARRLERP